MSYVPVDGQSDLYTLDVPMFGATGVNSPYLIDGPKPTLLDTGPASGADAVLDALDAIGVQPTAVSYLVPTHAHLDHAGGAGHLARACENARIVCHRRAVEYLTDEEKLVHLAESVERAIGMPAPYGEPVVIDRDRCVVVEGGETLDVGDRTLDVIDAPGHAPHQVCLYDRTADVLFGADAVGMRFGPDNHRPTTPPPDFDLEAALETIDRLREFAPERICYAHFGPGEQGAGTAELAAYRQLLPEFVDVVARARDRHGDDIGAVATAVDDRYNHWALETDVAGVLRYLEGQSGK